ncbi:MAG TPA: hypothetical protein DCR27_10545 [Lachnospiraceae bacterium]|nr:hypothetical protein [Lachnospiraceae bacterium]
MYGPKKPGWMTKCFWYCKEKCTTMTGLYVISVILLMSFTDIFVQWGFDADYSLTLPLYLFGILNLVLWFCMIKRIDKETSRPFFMEWLKHWDCDLLILLYGVLLFCFFGIMIVSYYHFQIPIYDWYGNYAGTYFSEGSFMVVFLPIALVNNAFIMVIIRHLKNPELRKATFCKKTWQRFRTWTWKRNLQYQRKYPFERKMQLETNIISIVLIAMAIVTLIGLGGYGFSRLLTAMLTLIGAGAVFIWIYQHKTFLTDVGTLVEEIHEVSTGNTLKCSAIQEDSMIYDAGEDLTHVFENLNNSVERQVKSEKMKIDLITNVSHDLKTPLTSIIGYIDLLKKTDLNDEARDYVEVLSRKSAHLKHMIQEVFEISKATSGNMDLHIETVDICTLMLQTLGDMEESIEASHRMIRKTLAAEPLYVISDGQRLYRIYQNLIENALKYSLEGSRIFIDVFGDEKTVTTIIKNTSSYEMNFTEETITERFTRGDINRTTEGHGLGLAIVKSFAEACGGKFHIDIDGDLFKATVKFPRHIPDPDELMSLAPEEIQEVS